MAEATYEKESELEVLFNDGEGLTHSDLNSASDQLRNYITNLLIEYQYAKPGNTVASPTGASRLRPLDAALQVEATGSGLQVRVHPGVVLNHFVTDNILAEMETEQLITADAADPSLDRIDTISAKVELITGTSTSRDFKDATTGAFSSSSFDKRNRAKVTLRYKPGTPAGSPSAPSVPSDEAKICEIYVAAAATTITDANINDHRYPWGYWKRHIMPKALTGGGSYNEGTLTWDFSGSGEIANCQVLDAHPGYRSLYLGSSEGIKRSNLRIASVYMLGQITTSPGYARIRARDFGDSSGGWQTFYDDIALTNLVTGAAGYHLHNFTISGNGPVWVNGAHNPRYLSGLVDPVAELYFNSGDATDFIRGITVEGYGIV